MVYVNDVRDGICKCVFYFLEQHNIVPFTFVYQTYNCVGLSTNLLDKVSPRNISTSTLSSSNVCVGTFKSLL